MTRWTQFVAMASAQLSSRHSLWDVAGRLTAQTRKRYPGHERGAPVCLVQGQRLSTNASTIDLCLKVFSWARCRTTRGAIQLHVGLDHESWLAAFVAMAVGKTHDLSAARALRLPRGSIVVMDRGYTDDAWYNPLNNNGIHHPAKNQRAIPGH